MRNGLRFAATSLAAIVCVLATPASLLADAPALRGFPPSKLADEAKWEGIVNASPSAGAATAYELALASHVHRMGSSADYDTAVFVRDHLKADGWDARLVEYVVPIAWPTEQRLEIVAPFHKTIDLYEAEISGDPYSKDHAAIGKPYAAYSYDGDVTGPVVYANYGIAADYHRLASAGVSVKGAIVVARQGKGGAVTKGRLAAKHGAIALFIYNDPSSDGYLHGDVYPHGPWRASSAAMRRTLGIDINGDPTAIGVPVPGAPHKPFSSLPFPHIPISPITDDAVITLLAHAGGPPAPYEWHGGLPIVMHLGGGSLRARFVLKTRRFFGPIWDVIAEMKGRVRPDQMVVTGGHRDAWTYGAVDPISGTVDLLQLGDAFGKLAKSGWRPYRSVIIGSWDGEEVGLFGSVAWVQQHDAELRAGCVAYVNTDEVAFGPKFYAGATPDLAGAMRQAASSVTAPDGRTLAAYWQAQSKAMTVEDIGGGSDHEPFVFGENLPAAGAGFGGPFGTYHSAYDDPASLRIFDPGMRRAAAAARFTSMLVLRLADAPYPDVRLADLAQAMSARVDAFAKEKTDADRRAAVLAELKPAVERFARAALDLDVRAEAGVGADDANAYEGTYAKLRDVEATFFDPKGRRDSQWQRSVLYGVSGYASGVLPTLDATLDPKYGDEALTQLQDILTKATNMVTQT